MSDSIPTQDQILACAQSLIERGGYNGFSYADIAATVGIRKASIHYHFPAKADLVRVLVEGYRKAAEASAGAFAASGMGPVEQLRAYTDYWAKCIQEGARPYCLCAMLASELPVLPLEVAAEVRKYFTVLSGWLETTLAQGAASGVLRLLDTPKIEAEVLMATVHGAMLSARAEGDARVFEIVTDAWLRRLSDQG
ncbi:TetR/AcrR family transcriptional regulator [Xanthobacter sp. ZOL 2024]